jgi:hypothetical protein
MTCPRCGKPVTASTRFCPQCGNELADVTMPPADVATSPEEQATFAGTGPLRSRTEHSASSGWLTSSDSISHGRFAPGAVLDSRYRIIGLLGRGGMGEVYRADDLRLGQPVALKFLPDPVAGDPVRLAQFHNEVRTARQVAHPNICRVYDIGEVEGHLYLSMEYVAGEDLATSLRRIGRFPEDKALEIARQLCAGLAAAHARGVIHRDLKPANIMLDDEGKVRVMDFGLASIGGATEVRAGTPAYMAPEQLLGREVTARSDIYALGLVLYELFTGRRALTGSTLNDLVQHHQTGQITPPSALVSSLDPAIERAILRCVDPNPSRRPASALAVAASLPGGDPLAAALAAGETPSPQMVAAAGEGAGLSTRLAVPVLAGVLIGTVALYALAMRANPLEVMRPEMNADVLAQKARELIRTLGYVERPQDEAYGFGWNDSTITRNGEAEYGEGSAARWRELVTSPPSPLFLWYRSSAQPLISLFFHHDLLTPGQVMPGDPPPITPGMIQLRIDHLGRLTSFEAIPPQVQEPPPEPAAIDWAPVLSLTGLDINTLQPAVPQWNWLATADSRVAWTGTWPGRQLPLRVEAASLYGRPVALEVIAPSTRPWRENEDGEAGAAAIVGIYLLVVLCVVIGGTLLASRNLREGRGDRAGALRLAFATVAALWVLWICQVHFTASVGTVAHFFLAIATTTFYGVLFWAIYLALEPFVRRHWPQTLMSWTTILSGRVKDPIVGRDVLFGTALGVLIALIIRLTLLYDDAPVLGAVDVLQGLRHLGAYLTIHVLYAVRSALLFFYLLFVLRVVLRNEWAAALAFVLLFAVLDALDSARPLFEGLSTFLYFSMLAAAVLRWGLTALTVSLLVANLLVSIPTTADTGVWYFGAVVVVVAIPLILAGWGFYRAVGGRLWEQREAALMVR